MTNRLFKAMCLVIQFSLDFKVSLLTVSPLRKPFLVHIRHRVAQSCSLRFGRAARQQLDLLPNCISGGAEVQRSSAVLRAKLLQSWDPMDCSPPGSSVHGILQARILEWVACPPPGDLPDPGSEPEPPMPPALAGRFFATSIIWEAPRERNTLVILSLEGTVEAHVSKSIDLREWMSLGSLWIQTDLIILHLGHSRAEWS